MASSITVTLVDLSIDEEELTSEEVLTSEEIQPKDWDEVSQYVILNPGSQNTKLFSFLALLNTYVPASYLLMDQCQKILGPPDPIHGGPPFEERMQPFTVFIKTSAPEQQVCMTDPAIAEACVQLLAESGVSRSATLQKFMSSFSGDESQPNIIQSIHYMLRKRQMGDKRKEKFSRLIQDIMENEKFENADLVLSAASKQFINNAFFPQTLSRLYYITRRGNYEKAEKWARKAIQRAPNNSYVADTLGQVLKNHLRGAREESNILNTAEKAIKAFKAVEEKAKKEKELEIDDMGIESISNTFNNRGLFGYIQVAKIVFEKLTSMENGEKWRKALTGDGRALKHSTLISNLKPEVENKFEFFEWYLTYSRPDIKSLEPPYFWKDVALCYEQYTTEQATQSTSFPGLLDCLYHGLHTSKGSRAEFEEAGKTVSDLEAIQNCLKTIYEEDHANVKVAERYILSNIILSNKMADHSPVTDLKVIIDSFLDQGKRNRSPEFYLLVLLLFWPEVQEKEDKTKRNEGSDQEQEAGQETAQLSPDFVLAHNLQEYVTLMEAAYEETHAKYIRGRYLLPLFFLGKGCGLSRWVHKSKLDAILENKVNVENANEVNEKTRRDNIQKKVDEMWSSGGVWEIPEIQEILLPVRAEASSLATPEEHKEQELFACTGEKKIKVKMEYVSNASTVNPMLLYLGFTIKGPVAFRVGSSVDKDL